MQSQSRTQVRTPGPFSLQDVIQRLRREATLEGHEGCVNTVSFNGTGELLFSGSDDRQIIVWDWEAKQKKLAYDSGHHNNVFQARPMPFTHDRTVVTCAADGEVSLENPLVLYSQAARLVLSFVAFQMGITRILCSTC